MWKLILFMTFTSFPPLCLAAETCVWMNEATAAGILSGPVTLRVSHLPHGAPAGGTANAKSSAGPMSGNAAAPNDSAMNADDEDCVFTQTGGEIRVEVRTMYQTRAEYTSRLESCGNDKVSLRALGNEAVACNVAREAASRSEQVIGRVRDRVFLVRVTSNDSAKGRAALRERARAAANVVAGNLF